MANTGKVKSLTRYINSKSGRKLLIKEKIRKTTTTTAGYEYVVLAKKGKNKTLLIHRLVAENFIPNPNNYSCINHIDENKIPQLTKEKVRRRKLELEQCYRKLTSDEQEEYEQLITNVDQIELKF